MATTRSQQHDMSKLEVQIMKIVTRNSGKTISERDIHNEIYSKLDIKDPVDNEDLKKKIRTILTILPSLYEDDIKVKKIRGILNVSHCSDESDDSLNGTYETVEQNDIDQQDSTSEKEEFYVVCKFIVDNKLDEYYEKENYDGTSVLQSLIEFSDEERLQKMLHHLSPLDRNKYGIKPVDCIKDIKIARLFIKQNMENISILETDTYTLKKSLDNVKTIITIYTIILFGIVFFNFLF